MNPRILLFCCLSTILAGCDDLIERNIDGYGVVLLTPPDGHVSSSNLVAFRWEAVPSATEYIFQLATPGFTHPLHIVVDSSLSAPRVDLPLGPGTYAWRVQARNNNSHTGFYTRSLTLTQSDSINELTPILSSPGQGAIMSTGTITFQWQSVQGAETHRFELRQGGQTGPLLNAQIVEGTNVILNDLPEGALTWGVQGQSGGASSQFSYRNLLVDLTAPTAPILLQPQANVTMPNSTITFTWESGTDASSTTDSLYILNSNNAVIRDILANGNSLSDSLGSGTFQWFIRTRDAAGHTTSSTIRGLTVQ